METTVLYFTHQALLDLLVKTFKLLDGKTYAIVVGMQTDQIGTRIQVWALTNKHVITWNSHQAWKIHLQHARSTTHFSRILLMSIKTCNIISTTLQSYPNQIVITSTKKEPQTSSSDLKAKPSTDFSAPLSTVQRSGHRVS